MNVCMLSIYLSIHPSIYPSIYLSILDYLSVHASKCVKLVQGQRSWLKDIDCFEFTALTTCKLIEFHATH